MGTLNSGVAVEVMDSAQAEAVTAVIGERVYQDQQFPDAPDLWDTRDLLTEYARRLGFVIDSGQDDKALTMLRKIAALALRGMEVHGVAWRKGFSFETEGFSLDSAVGANRTDALTDE